MGATKNGPCSIPNTISRPCALVEADVPRADDRKLAFARTVHDHNVDRRCEAALDQLLGDGPTLAALGPDEVDPPIPD